MGARVGGGFGRFLCAKKGAASPSLPPIGNFEDEYNVNRYTLSRAGVVWSVRVRRANVFLFPYSAERQRCSAAPSFHWDKSREQQRLHHLPFLSGGDLRGKLWLVPRGQIRHARNLPSIVNADKNNKKEDEQHGERKEDEERGGSGRPFNLGMYLQAVRVLSQKADCMIFS